MKLNFLSFILIGFLFSCGTNPNPKQSKYNTLKVESLTEKDLFTYVKVKAFLEHQEKSKSIREDYFLKGLNAYKNEKKLDSANYYFKRSILNSPSNIAYYEWANVMMDEKKYDQAIEAYTMAERMGYEPFSKVLYNIACAYSLKKETQLSGQYLEYALQAGYSNISNIEKDADLANLRLETYTYKHYLNKGLKGISNSENLFWLSYKRQYDKLQFPIKLDENLDLLLLNEETAISYDFEKYVAEMRDEKFSRETSKGFYYLAQIKETANYVAMIYVVKEEFYGDQSPLTFRLVTYTNSGKLIDKKEIAGRTDFSKPLKSALIKNDMSICVTSYKTEFEKNPDDEGYYNNKVVKKTKLNDTYLTINEVGKIVPLVIYDLSVRSN